jgi:hypothetical protein
MTSEYNKVKNILIKHDALGGDLDDLADVGGPLYDDLYDYYVGSGEMPYGTAKARDGDPQVWIADRLYDLGLVTDQKTPETEPVADARDHHLINQNFKKMVGK